MTYDAICQQYVRYGASHYGSPTIVFDGYSDGPSTKDSTQHRRSRTYVGATVLFSGSMIFKGKKDDFLTNKENKHRFIALLRTHLECQGCRTEQALADADLLIVQTAIAASEQTTKPRILVGDDTDLLVLLCFHTKSTTSNLYFRPEPRHGAKKAARCRSIVVFRETVGPQVYKNILFTHAVLGCDTTSAIYGLGKGGALKLVTSNTAFRNQAEVFSNPHSTTADITAAGEAALVTLYKGCAGDKLDVLRLQRFHQRVSISKTFVDPKVLPPTSAAAKFHSLRVYLQVQQWMGQRPNMNPEDWGWYLQGGRYLPILTQKEAAPSELLEVVRCNCKMGCANRLCTCRKHGLECSTACGQCRGVCSNAASLVDCEEENGMVDE